MFLIIYKYKGNHHPMDRIKELELKKLIKELDYIEENYNYVSEIVSNSDDLFTKAIDDVLEDNPSLKKAYNNKLEQALNKDLENKIKELKNEISQESEKNDDNKEEKESIEESVGKVDGDIKLKQLYRSIAKITHPDKVKDKKKNNTYINATVAYKDKDRIAMYRICDGLDINYSLDESDKDNMLGVIDSYRDKTVFLESTFTWKWFNTEDNKTKENIVMTFIKMKLR
jgi:hypothetical protein